MGDGEEGPVLPHHPLARAHDGAAVHAQRPAGDSHAPAGGPRGLPGGRGGARLAPESYVGHCARGGGLGRAEGEGGGVVRHDEDVVAVALSIGHPPGERISNPTGKPRAAKGKTQQAMRSRIMPRRVRAAYHAAEGDTGGKLHGPLVGAGVHEHDVALPRQQAGLGNGAETGAAAHLEGAPRVEALGEAGHRRLLRQAREEGRAPARLGLLPRSRVGVGGGGGDRPARRAPPPAGEEEAAPKGVVRAGDGESRARAHHRRQAVGVQESQHPGDGVHREREEAGGIVGHRSLHRRGLTGLLRDVRGLNARAGLLQLERCGGMGGSRGHGDAGRREHLGVLQVLEGDDAAGGVRRSLGECLTAEPPAGRGRGRPRGEHVHPAGGAHRARARAYALHRPGLAVWAPGGGHMASRTRSG
mmetsp:Transcript_50177/g.160750  ORF Transcript_50177/g.160750 Transcript_50177/m.160750 type:complete len:415 (-) Transcript_50177:452-1696(-)